jgi:hypothetical protein
MTSQPEPQPQTSPATPGRGGRPSRPLWIGAMVAGTLVVLLGIAVAAAGAALLGVFGSDGTVTSSSHSLSTPRVALVSSSAKVRDVASAADVVGDPRIRISVRNTGDAPGLFIGIGPSRQVDRYLASAPVDEVTDFEVDPFRLDRRPRDGAAQPASPSSQRFWVAKATGPDAATLRWRVRDGDYRLVLMNADGRRRVGAAGNVALTVPHMPRVAWGLIAGGLLLALPGVVLIVIATRRLRSRGPSSA